MDRLDEIQKINVDNLKTGMYNIYDYYDVC